MWRKRGGNRNTSGEEWRPDKEARSIHGRPAPGGDDDHPEDYIIIDDTDSDPDSSDDDYEDEAGADIMECNDQTSKDLSLCAYRASPWIKLASTRSIDEYQNSKCTIYYNVWSRMYKIKQYA